MELSNLSIEQLKELRNNCQMLIKENIQNENDKLLKDIEKKVNEMTITDRVRNFYENTNISTFNFLYESMFHSAGNNIERLDYYKLLTYDKNTANQLRNIGINSSYDYTFKLNYKTGFLDNQDEINEKIKESKKLIYLYNFFLDMENVINYQGAFYTFKYINDTLNSILINSEKSDFDLINENWEQKIKYVSEHLIDIANYLLKCRNSIPKARLFICNIGLKKTAKKKSKTITFNEKILMRAISFGTTIDKLEQGNYEDSKQLIYVPYKK